MNELSLKISEKNTKINKEMVHSYIEMRTYIRLLPSFMNSRCNKVLSLHLVNLKNNVFIKY
jgi:hypothetical protein